MRARTSAALVALLIAIPSALAATSMSAAQVDVVGDAQLTSDLQALFLVVGKDAPVWEATAATVVVERHYIDNPRVADRFVIAPTAEWKTETLTLTDATLAGADAREGGALLARGEATSTATTQRGLLLELVTDPRLDQVPPNDAEAGEGDPMEIHESLAGEFIAVEVSEGLVEIRGDLRLDLRDVDYVASDAQGERDLRTGTHAQQDVVVARADRDEYHVVTLTDAVLRLEVAQPLDLLSKNAELSLDGQLLLDGTAVPGLLDAGRATLGLSPVGGLVQASRADVGAASASAPAPFATSVALPVAASLVLVLALALALARRGRADDVELALVAMSERRWSDALPRLRRALRRRPDDATLLLDHAICLEMLGRLPAAARAYEATLRRAPRSAEAHLYLARTLAKLRQEEPGTVHLQTALELDPRLLEMARSESAFRTLGVSR